MKVEFHHLKGKDLDPSMVKDGRLSFVASRPIVVQPSEIMRVQTDLVVRVPGKHILSIVTAQDLYKRTGELFPGNLVITSTDGDFLLELPVRNCGGTQLNILPEQVIAVGFLMARKEVEVGTFDIHAVSNNKQKSKPSKKNSNIKFELN